jgi:hypothetical protein
MAMVFDLEEAKNLAGEKSSRLIQIRLATPSLEKNLAVCQHYFAPSLNYRFAVI